jgi:hypothetical protein
MMTEATNLEARRAEISEKLAALRVDPDVAALVQKADQAVASFKSEAAALESALDELA